MKICPDCSTENIAGADTCEGCGRDLRNLDLPEAGDLFSAHLISDQLKELGSEQLRLVSPGDPVAYAIHVMQEARTGCVLVSEEGKLVGILTEQDVLMKAAGGKVDLNAVAVREIMTPDPVVLREEDTLAVALHKMSIGGFRHIPLVQQDKAARVISIQDVFRYISAYLETEAATTS
jgi:predicted transcriptional regulator